MARFGAIAATSAALLGLLDAAKSSEPEFATAACVLLRSEDLQKSAPDRLAVSLYLYHINVNVSRRTAPCQWGADGVRRPRILPLDLHYLMTAWAKDAGTQQRLLGWAIRVVQDAITLPAGLLNAFGSDQVFGRTETVEVLWETLSARELYDIWDVARAKQQPSAAYVARVVEIESAIVPPNEELVQVTAFGYGAERS